MAQAASPCCVMQRRLGDARQQVALVCLGHHGQLRPEAVGTNGGDDLLEQRKKLDRRVACEKTGKCRIEFLGRRCKCLTRARSALLTAASYTTGQQSGQGSVVAIRLASSR